MHFIVKQQCTEINIFMDYLQHFTKKKYPLDVTSPVNRCRLVVTQSRKNRGTREHIRHLFYCFFDDLQILFSRLIPDVVRRQIASPDDVVYILKERNDIFRACVNQRLFLVHVYSRGVSPRCASACCRLLSLACRICGSHPT